MWTTEEWTTCLARTAEYEHRERKRSSSKNPSGAEHSGIDNGAENSGLEQWLQKGFVQLDRTERQIWFWNNHD